MKIPRDVNGPQLVKALRVLGYAVDRQKGSHIRVTTPTALTYDANGNCTQDESGNTYAWDALNRLTKITYPSTAYSTFAYDGLSRRTQIAEYNSSHVLQTTKNYLWVGSEIAEERDASNNVTKRFFPQGEQQLVSGTLTPFYYTRDHLGSVREMCNASGAVVARYYYDPYGKTTLVSGTNFATKQYAGMYFHVPSGMYLSRGGEKPSTGRIYDPSTGRWPSRDPIEELGGLNLYTYCNNDPISTVDPDGLRSRGVPPRGPITTPQGDPAGGDAMQDAEDTENKDMTHGHADYGGGFAHCMANCLLKRRYGALFDWIVRMGWDVTMEHHHPNLPGFPDTADITSPGDIIANGQGARAADGPCSCEGECLKRFPKLPKDQTDTFYYRK